MLVIIYLLLAGALVYYIWSFLQVIKLIDHNITESHTIQPNVMNMIFEFVLNFKIATLAGIIKVISGQRPSKKVETMS